VIYTVFSTTDSPFQQWQSELLEYSWREAEQPGELIRFVATDGNRLPAHRHARTIATPPSQVHPDTGDDYAPYNKPAALLHWLRTEQPEGTVLLVDPDCVFQSAIRREVAEGAPVSQRWIGLAHARHGHGFALDRRFAFLADHGVRPRIPAQLGMIPTLIHTRDLARIAARWLEVTALVRQQVTDPQGQRMWESDMYAYAIVAAEAGLEHELTSLGICTNWSPDDAVDAPIIHYCQAVESHGGGTLWSKNHYQPWGRVARPERARHAYGRTLLTLLNRCVNARAATELADVRPRGCVGVREVREATGMVLCAPGSNREFALNRAAERLWALCDGTRTVSAIRGVLAREFEGTEGALENVLIDALAAFHEAHLLVFERG
jgi:coenzyme PQQ synthesis protein D (PqqD)